MKKLLNSSRRCSNHVFLLEQLMNYQDGKNLMQKQLPRPTTWKDMLKNVLRDIVNWQTRRHSNYTKSPVFAWLITISRRKCPQIDLKCLYLARIGRPDILWSVNKFVRSVTKWTQACGRRLARLISYIHHSSDYQHYCYVHGSALSIAFIPRLLFCWRPWGLKINLGESFMHLRTPNICPYQLDV